MNIKPLLLLSSIMLLTSTAFARDSFMDKCIKSWIGYPLDSVIEKWGYPDQEKVIAGKKLFVWETYDYDTNFHSGGGVAVISTDKKGNNTIIASGGQPQIEHCQKTLETDENNNIINGQWKGNICPKFYVMGKKFVNPLNDEWAKKKNKK